jgi:hypothetical protein
LGELGRGMPAIGRRKAHRRLGRSSNYIRIPRRLDRGDGQRRHEAVAAREVDVCGAADFPQENLPLTGEFSNRGKTPGVADYAGCPRQQIRSAKLGTIG